jgi:hypothetical protein
MKNSEQTKRYTVYPIGCAESGGITGYRIYDARKDLDLRDSFGRNDEAKANAKAAELNKESR